MADITKITVGNTVYDVRDAVSRNTLDEHETAIDEIENNMITNVTLTATDDGNGTVTLAVNHS